MAKRKKSVDLTMQNIEFQSDEGVVRIVRFNPNTMTVDVNIHQEGMKVRSETLPFAHLPKPLKQRIRPLS